MAELGIEASIRASELTFSLSKLIVMRWNNSCRNSLHSWSYRRAEKELSPLFFLLFFFPKNPASLPEAPCKLLLRSLLPKLSDLPDRTHHSKCSRTTVWGSCSHNWPHGAGMQPGAPEVSWNRKTGITQVPCQQGHGMMNVASTTNDVCSRCPP